MSLATSFFVGLFCGTAQAATVTLSAVTSPVTEGGDLTVRCNIPSAEPRDVVVGLAVDASSTAENGYDAEFVEFFQCIILAGALTGTVNIPTFADTITETSVDTLVITGRAITARDIVDASTASFTITDDGMGTTPMIRVRPDFYRDMEVAGSLTVVLELVDGNGDVVPIEDDDVIGFTFVDGTAVDGVDYASIATANIFGSTMGIATVEASVPITLLNDKVPENVENFELILDQTLSTVIVDTSSRQTLFIEDDDKPEIFVLNSDSVLPHRSRKPVFQYVFTENPNSGITWDHGPNVLSDSIVNDIDNGIKLILPTRSRFNWYTFSTTETTTFGTFDHFTTSLISATGFRKRAPINVLTGSTVTVCPASLDPGETDLGFPVTITIMGVRKFNSRVRWSVYRNPGTSHERRLPQYNGKTSLTFTKLSDIGVYAVYRRSRGQQGVQYTAVLPSVCPCGTYHSVGFCDGGPIQCQHGGFVDPQFNEGLCTCPPGYVGRFCEIPVDPGQFGSYGQYLVDQFFPANTNGRGITFSFSYPFGGTCAPEFYGPGCWRSCPEGTFGAGCEFDCHCIDEKCALNGKCANGCAAGFSGLTCQITM